MGRCGTSSYAREQLRQGAEEATRPKQNRDRGVKQAYLRQFVFLDESPENLRLIPDLWNQIEKWPFNNNQLVRIIENTAKAIDKHRSLADSREARQHVEDNISLWIHQASSSPDPFDKNQVERVIRAFKTLGINPLILSRPLTPTASVPSVAHPA